MAKEFIPKTDGELSIFLGTFKEQLTAVGAGLGLTAQEVTDGGDACDATVVKISNAATKKMKASRLMQKKQQVKKTLLISFVAIPEE